MSLIKPLKKDDFEVYHYIKKGNSALKEGILSFSLNKNKYELLEKIYFSPCILDVPNATKKNTLDKVLIQIKDLDEIDYSSINWDI